MGNYFGAPKDQPADQAIAAKNREFLTTAPMSQEQIYQRTKAVILSSDNDSEGFEAAVPALADEHHTVKTCQELNNKLSSIRCRSHIPDCSAVCPIPFFCAAKCICPKTLLFHYSGPGKNTDDGFSIPGVGDDYVNFKEIATALQRAFPGTKKFVAFLASCQADPQLQDPGAGRHWYSLYARPSPGTEIDPDVKYDGGSFSLACKKAFSNLLPNSNNLLAVIIAFYGHLNQPDNIPYFVSQHCTSAHTVEFVQTEEATTEKNEPVIIPKDPEVLKAFNAKRNEQKKLIRQFCRVTGSITGTITFASVGVILAKLYWALPLGVSTAIAIAGAVTTAAIYLLHRSLCPVLIKKKLPPTHEEGSTGANDDEVAASPKHFLMQSTNLVSSPYMN